ncbi:AC4 [Pepper leafroll virus]|uniref:AC4 n=1 Tax=Pepper leafroll virus TaxID=1387160 RepID=A0A023I4P9_9GEMI|nr:AC4 [Pepper leafroll virus]AGT57883.1 AC4 [Pepper leafroll virus]
MRMGNLIYTCLSSSKENSDAKIQDSSTWSPQQGQHISIQTFRELRARQMSRPTWRKTETSLILEFSKSMEDQLEEVANLPMIRTPRFSMHSVHQRHLIY